MERISQGKKAVLKLLETREISEIPELLDNCEEVSVLESEKLRKINFQEFYETIGISGLFEYRSVIVSEIIENNTEGAYNYYIDLVREEIDKIANNDNRIKAQIGLILLQAELYKSAGKDEQYNEAINDATEYAENMNLISIVTTFKNIA